jgi:hypothetical protein
VVDELGPDVPLHFTAFHPDYKLLDRPPTPAATLAGARDRPANGVRYAYTGNVHDEAGGSTFCHACGERLIGRDWYTLTDWKLTDDGRCRRCGTRMRGRVRRAARHLGRAATAGTAGWRVRRYRLGPRPGLRRHYERARDGCL